MLYQMICWVNRVHLRNNKYLFGEDIVVHFLEKEEFLECFQFLSNILVFDDKFRLAL